MSKTSRRILTVLLAVPLVGTFCQAGIPTAHAESASYWDPVANRSFTVDAEVITQSWAQELTGGQWYVCTGSVTRIGEFLGGGRKDWPGLIVNAGSGPANLILADGCNLTLLGYAQPGLAPALNSELNIYGQHEDGSGGRLDATGSSLQPGISYARATVRVFGGTVIGNGGEEGRTYGGAAGIGTSSGSGTTGGTLEVYGGTVIGIGQDGGAGIGGGWETKGGTINIHGGSVTATGSRGSAGIGGGWEGENGTITITGGSVVARAMDEGSDGLAGAGIGGGGNRGGGSVTISGGTVVAQGGKNGSGIGGGGIGLGIGADVIITGGSVHAIPGTYTHSSAYVVAEAIGRGETSAANPSSSGTLTDGQGNNVYLTTLTIADPNQKQRLVTAGNLGFLPYGLKDVRTDDSATVYTYLPSSGFIAARLTLNGMEYSNPHVDIKENHSNAAILYAPALPTPTISLSRNGVVTWDPIAIADPAYLTGYRVEVSKGGKSLATYTRTPNEALSVNVQPRMREEGEGGYTVTVTALGDTVHRSDSLPATEYAIVRPLPSPTNVQWDKQGNASYATWDKLADETDVDHYSLSIDGGTPTSVNSTGNNQRWFVSDALPGSTFTVTAIAKQSSLAVDSAPVTSAPLPKQSTVVSASGPKDIIYGGALGDPSASRFPYVPGATFTYHYTGTLSDSAGTAYDSDEKPTQPGTYYVTATLVDPDYEGSGTSYSFSIGKKPLSWNTDAEVESKVYDGTDSATVTTQPTLDGLINNDSVGIVPGEAIFHSGDAGTGILVAGLIYTITGVDAWKYVPPYQYPSLGTADITKRPVTITGFTAQDKVYDGTTRADLVAPTLTAAAGLIGNDVLTVTAAGTFADKRPGQDKTVAISGIVLAGTSADNYQLAQTGYQTTTTADITAKPSSIDVTIADKNYDGLTTATVASANPIGTITGDAVSVALPYPAASFETMAQGTNIPVSFAGSFSLAGLDADCYSLTQPTGVTGTISAGFSAARGIHYTVSTPDGTNGWFWSNDFVITAMPGYQVGHSDSDAGPWTDSLTFSTETANGHASFYVRDMTSKEISTPTTESYKIDKTAPSGQITMENSQWTQFLNTVTFGLFFKKTVDVTITGADANAYSLSYQTVASQQTYNQNGPWTPGSSFSVQPDQKFIVYARIMDDAGNVTVINSDGVVVYTDSVLKTTSISYTRTSPSDVTAQVTLNGNTIDQIKNNTVPLQPGSDYTVDDVAGVITFKASYLSTLAKGTYRLTVTYKPLGETYQESAANDQPASTDIVLTVGLSSQSISLTGLASTYTYGDKDINLSTSGGSGSGQVTYTSSDTTVATVAGDVVTIHKAGVFSIAATKEADSIYAEATFTSTLVTVREATPTVTVTGDNVPFNSDVSLTVTVSGPGVTVSGSVTITEGAALTQTSTLANGQALFTIVKPNSGSHDYTITYLGQPGFYTQAAVTKHIGVNMIDQTGFAIAKPSQHAYGDADFMLTATGGQTSSNATFSVATDDIIGVTADGRVSIHGAGTATVTAVKPGDANRNPITASLDITINPRDIGHVTVTVTGPTVFTGSQLQPDFDVTDGTLPIDIGDYTNAYGTNISVTQLGTIVLTGQRNYSGTKQVDFTITKADPVYTVPTPRATYGDVLSPAQLPTGWAWEDSGVVGTAGTHTFHATYTPADTTNYNTIAHVSVTMTVDKKDITVTANDHSKYSGAADPPLTYSVSPSLIGNDTLSGSLMYTGSAVGSYPIVQDIPFSNDNYAITFVDGTFTIVTTPQVNQVIDAINKLPDPISTFSDADEVASVSKALDALSPGDTAQIPGTVMTKLAEAQKQAGDINHTSPAYAASVVSDNLPWNVRLDMGLVPQTDLRYPAFADKLGDKDLVDLYSVNLIDTLTGSTYRLSNGQSVTISIVRTQQAGEAGVVIAHEKQDSTLELLTTKVAGAKVTFDVSSVGLYGVTINKPQQPVTPSPSASPSPMARPDVSVPTGGGIPSGLPFGLGSALLIMLGGVILVCEISRRRKMS